ncbi:methyltransferase N6AMT1 [Rhipicephalus sanguineus]|uniref:methyltransferase N6AMT1 n=1 Tax=Rhipicephalus sanguineus TaxID=34632 RepID=UPI0018945999|nr:methyltransferase N6AMT1 [Rhipicephalus sanguineus]
METPIVSSFSESEAATVYEPAEDSFLLIDALEKELPEITRRRPSLCVEVGSGSGIVTAAIAKALGRTCCFIATDINEKAAAMTKRTCERNGADVDAVVNDLVGCLADRLRNQVDLLIFNPPYVVTPSEEVQGDQLLTRSWAGGIKGREVMDRLAPYVSQILSDHGLYFLLVIKENDPDDVCKFMSTHGLQGRCVISRRCGAESLSVLRFEKHTNKS